MFSAFVVVNPFNVFDSKTVSKATILYEIDTIHPHVKVQVDRSIALPPVRGRFSRASGLIRCKSPFGPMYGGRFIAAFSCLIAIE